MEITKDTRVSEILEEYGDIADVMEVFGVKRVAGYSVRRMLTKAITVEWAARVHRVPLDAFLATLNEAVASQVQRTDDVNTRDHGERDRGGDDEPAHDESAG